MIGRREFGLWGMSAAALLPLAAAGLAQGRSEDAAGGTEDDELTQALLQCSQACCDCQRACNSCNTHCVHLLHKCEQTARVEALVACLFACQDCADFCGASAQITARGGPLVILICKACADACAECAQVCEQFSEDEQITRCAEACRACEKSCRDMLQML